MFRVRMIVSIVDKFPVELRLFWEAACSFLGTYATVRLTSLANYIFFFLCSRILSMRGFLWKETFTKLVRSWAFTLALRP